VRVVTDVRVLMITIGYPPDEIGGTEVYVSGLVDALEAHRCTAEVAYVSEAPSGDDIAVRSEVRGRTPVHRIVVPRSRFRLEAVLFDAPLRNKIIDAFRRVIRDRRPDVVHMHPLQLGLEAYLLEALKADGRTLVLTYHSSTTSCARGDLVRFGRRPCDGVIRQVACTECLLHFRGVPRPLAGVLARLPLAWHRAGYGRIRLRALKKVKALCSLPLVVEARRACWTRAMTASDRVIAVCEWVKAVCLSNGVPERKLVVSRHGHRFSPPRTAPAASPVVRFGYLGRLSPEKGIGVLIGAVESLDRGVPFEIEFISATIDARRVTPEEQRVIQQLRGAAGRDPRLRVLGAVADERLTATIAAWDAMIVPSLWFESGPQVIYEAFAAGTPVIGSRRGGIAELVTEGETGFLFEPGDSRALAALIARFAADPASLRALRSRIPPVRTTADVAADMVGIYRSLVKEHVAV
jgi:glycosyltransferase involved in cell wall biosynthesis